MSLSVVAKSSVNKQDGFDSKKGKSKHNTASKATQEQHLNSNSQDFIKSIGWECDKTPLGHTKHYSWDYDTYDYSQRSHYHKPKSSWGGKSYYSKPGYYNNYDYKQ
jgi:hypothetical protein